MSGGGTKREGWRKEKRHGTYKGGRRDKGRPREISKGGCGEEEEGWGEIDQISKLVKYGSSRSPSIMGRHFSLYF